MAKLGMPSTTWSIRIERRENWKVIFEDGYFESERLKRRAASLAAHRPNQGRRVSDRRRKRPKFVAVARMQQAVAPRLPSEQAARRECLGSARWLDEQASCAGSLFREPVLTVPERTLVDRHAAAADAVGQPVTQLLQLVDATIEVVAPGA